MQHTTTQILLLTLPLLFAVGVSAVCAAETPAKTYKNSIGMEFVLIPAGTFQMGCPPEEEGCRDDEMPRHEVTISRPFYLGKYPVTQAQWKAVMGKNPSWNEAGFFKGWKRPVERVTWNDVQEFIEKLNAKEGHNRYRLPTEAEWEYAARAGSTTAYSFGDDKEQLAHYAWYRGNPSLFAHETQPVGRRRPNAWGLHDMYGNVLEWVQDWYGPYSAEAVTDPQGPEAGKFRVLRGGFTNSGPKWCRSASRFRYMESEPDKCSMDWGFRLALSLEQ